MPRLPKDPLVGTYLSGARFFIDRPFHDHVCDNIKGGFPNGPDGFAGLWPHIKTHTMMDPWRAASIAQRLWESRNLPGDVIECGVFMGGMSVMMALLLRRWGIHKRVYMLDSFKGLPRPDPERDTFYRLGWFAIGRNPAEHFAVISGVRDSVTIVEGWFKDTLPQLADKTFCMAHVDGDLYESTMTCLTHLVPRMSPGAAMVMDDYDDGGGGVKRALHEHLGETGEILHRAPIPQAYYRIGQKHRGKGFQLSEKELHANKPFRIMVAEVDRRMREDTRNVARLHKLVNG